MPGVSFWRCQGMKKSRGEMDLLALMPLQPAVASATKPSNHRVWLHFRLIYLMLGTFGLNTKQKIKFRTSLTFGCRLANYPTWLVARVPDHRSIFPLPK